MGELSVNPSHDRRAPPEFRTVKVGSALDITHSVHDHVLKWTALSALQLIQGQLKPNRRFEFSPLDIKGSAKNKFAELALRFGLDLADPIEQSRGNRELFRGQFY